MLIATIVAISVYVAIAIFVGFFCNEMMNIDSPVNKFHLRSVWAGLTWPLLVFYLLLEIALNIRR